MQMPTSSFNNHQLFYFWVVFSNRMGVLPYRLGKTAKNQNLEQVAHFAPVLNFEFLDLKDKYYEVLMRYAWKGN